MLDESEVVTIPKESYIRYKELDIFCRWLMDERNTISDKLDEHEFIETLFSKLDRINGGF